MMSISAENKIYPLLMRKLSSNCRKNFESLLSPHIAAVQCDNCVVWYTQLISVNAWPSQRGNFLKVYPVRKKYSLTGYNPLRYSALQHSPGYGRYTAEL